MEDIQKKEENNEEDINEEENEEEKEEEEFQEEKKENEIKFNQNQSTNSENMPHFSRFFNKSKTTRLKPGYYQMAKSIKSSSFTNDSSLNNDPLSSSRDSEEKRTRRSFDIEYPSLKRCHSTKKYHYSKDYKDIIKEEKYEDEDSFCSSRSKFSSYTIMPKDNLFFLEKRKLFDESTIKAISTMEPVPETDDDNLIFQKPKIQLLTDRKEDSKINTIPNNLIVKKKPLDEDEIIQEVKELDGIFDEEFDQKLDSIKIKYKSFYDKEEPPILFSGLQGECKPFNSDDIPDEIEEADFEDDAKEVIRKNSILIQKKKNIADEIDEFKRPKRMNSKFVEIKDPKMLIDEKDELNNKDENEEKEEDSEKGSKNSNE